MLLALANEIIKYSLAAVRESGNGTNRTSRAGLAMSAPRGNPEVTG